MSHTNFIDKNEIVVFVDNSLFSKDAIFKCLYWYGDKFNSHLSSIDNNFVRISITLKSNTEIKVDELEFYLHKLESDLIDFNLRDIVSKETKNVRDLLIAKAFSNGEFDEEPIGDVSDPIGFNINEIVNE